MAYTRGIDVSTFQDDERTPQRIDWTKPGPAGYKFVINRLTAATTLDSDFVYNYQQQAKHGLIRGAYGWWDYRAGAPESGQQGRAFGLIERSYPSDMPVIWCDFEHPGGNWPALPPRETCLQMMLAYKSQAESTSGKQAGIYTNTAMLMHLMSAGGRTVDLPAWLRAMPLWIAAWPTVPAGYTLEGYIQAVNWRPNLRGQWERFTFWQYGTPARGRELGMESGDIDVNFFNCTEAELLTWCGKEQPAPEPPPTQGETMYEGYAIGLETSTATWSNPSFAFIVGRGGRGHDEPNPQLKAIETKAAAEGKPFLIQYDLNIHYYSAQQYPMREENWPAEHMDFPWKTFLDAVRPRNPRGVIIRVMDHTDFDGKKAEPAWINFVASVFIRKAEKWLKANKPGVKLYLQTSFPFCHEYAPGIINWADNWNQVVEQDAEAVDKSYPVGKPAYIGNTTRWKFWKYYKYASGAALVMFDGTPEKLAQELGVSVPGPGPDPDPGPGPGPGPDPEKPTLEQLAQRVTAAEQEIEKLRATLKAIGQELIKD